MSHVTVHFGRCEEDGSNVCERFTAASTTYQKNLRHWSREGDETGLCSSRGKEMQIKKIQSVEVLHSKPPGVLVETRWCIVLFIKIFGFQLSDY